MIGRGLLRTLLRPRALQSALRPAQVCSVRTFSDEVVNDFYTVLTGLGFVTGMLLVLKKKYIGNDILHISANHPTSIVQLYYNVRP